MQFRQKIGYVALGGLLVLAGHVLPGLIVPRAAAQGKGNPSAEFDTLTVRSLKVIDAKGTPGVTISTDDRGGDVRVLGKNGTTRAAIRVWSRGGAIHVYDNRGELPALQLGARVLITVDDEGGVVSTYNRQGMGRVHR